MGVRGRTRGRGWPHPPAGRLRAAAGAAACLLLATLAPPAAAASLVRSCPPSAAPTAGDTVTLQGSGFGGPGPGAAVDFVGADLTLPAVAGQILAWTPTEIQVRVPGADVWPGATAIEAFNPGVWTGPTGRLPVTISASHQPMADAAAAWVPAPGGGGAGAGQLRIGWYDATGAVPSPVRLELPTAAFTVPASGLTVTVNGVSAIVSTSGSGTVATPAAGAAPATTLAVTPAEGSVAAPGQVFVTVFGLTAAAGLSAVGVQVAGAQVAPQVRVGAAAVGYRVTVPSQVPAGSPFPVRIEALDASGRPIGQGGQEVYLAGSAASGVDFGSAGQSADGATTADIALADGVAEVTATAGVAGAARIEVVDAAGRTGSATLNVTAPPDDGGLQLQVFAPFSDFVGALSADTSAAIDALGRHSGLGTSGRSALFAGFWPLGVGHPYEAEWSGILYIRAPAPLPSGMPQPTLQFAFLNVAAETSTALITPIGGTGASVDGVGDPLYVPTATDGQGWRPPAMAQLTPGQYLVRVRTEADVNQTSAGDALEYSEAFSVPATSASAPATTGWTPLRALPPAAFLAPGIPDPAFGVPIGAAAADDQGAPIALQQPALIEGGRTLVPLRAIAEALGARVDYDPATQGITVTGPDGTVTHLTEGSDTATVGSRTVQLDQGPVLLPPGVTMVPLRFIGEALGWSVGWDNAARTAVLLPPLASAAPDGSTAPPRVSVVKVSVPPCAG